MHRLLLLSALALALSLPAPAQNAAPVHVVEQAPVHISKVAPNVYLVDFGQVAFGNLSLTPGPELPQQPVTLRFGEALKDGRIDTHPPGTVRYAEVPVSLSAGTPIVVAPPADARNTHPPAVLTLKSLGVLIPFRWVEVEGWPSELRASQIRRRAVFDSSWSDAAATFHSSDPMLNKVWELCHYSIKATTFAGIFVDGDRERIAYEADAYINQLGYYAADADPRLPRATFARLMKYPTWPSEWTPQMVFMAYADWMQTGDLDWLRAQYQGLKTKLLAERLGPDGLVTSTPDQIKHADIVDWPPHERDGYVFTRVNTVVNAFHLRALREIAELAAALGKADEARQFNEQEQRAQAQFQTQLFNPAEGLYRDGVGTDHTSLHANLFPLAFDLVPPDDKTRVADWLVGRGMAGSPYAAQYLLEALFKNGQTTAALALITANGDRSWKHMVDSGTTITWEAWDQKYKPNQDWNHAWGAAPANLLPRFVLGAQPLTPGWKTVLIQPHPGSLRFASGTMPTPRGELAVSWTNDQHFRLKLNLPPGMAAKVELPAQPNVSQVWSGGRRLPAHRQGQGWTLEDPVSGAIELELR